jgi:hypothetical protein
MRIYEIAAPDGRIYEIEGPEGASKAQLFQAVLAKNPYAGQSTQELKEAPSAPSKFKDVGIAALTGLAGGAQSLTDLFGAGNIASRGLSSIQQSAQEGLSEARKEEIARDEELKKRAEGSFLGEAGAGLRSFTNAPLQEGIQALFSSAPIIAAGALTGGAGAVPLTAARAGLAARAAQAGRVATSGTGVGAAMGLGGQKGQDYETVKRELMNRGMPEPEAEAKAQEAAAYSLQNLPRQAVAAGAGALEGRYGVEGALSNFMKQRAATAAAGKAFTPELPPGYGKAAVSSIFGEMIPEGIQAATGQVGTNIALTQAGIPTDALQGVTSAVAHDAAVAALLGTAVTPFQKANMVREFNQTMVERQQKAIEEDAKRREEFERKRQEEIAKTRQQLGIEEKPMLALPAPAEKLEAAPPVTDPLMNPLGNLSKDELGRAVGVPDVYKYVDKYRRDNGLPKLETYSIEDLKDAQPGLAESGEAGALNSIIAFKSGFTADAKVTADDVLGMAQARNVETGTKGFDDFLTRTTGVDSLEQMEPPQLFAVHQALAKLPEPAEGGAPIILPQGTNAKLFKQNQYNQAISAVDTALSGQGLTLTPGPMTEAATLDVIKQATGLTLDKHAKALMDTAVQQGDLDLEMTPRYEVTDPATGVRVGDLYKTRKEAQAAAKPKGLNVNEITETAVVAPKTATVLPDEFDIQEGEFKAGEAPDGFDIVAGDKVLRTEPTYESAAAKIEGFTKNRQRLSDKASKDIVQAQEDIQASEDNLNKMASLGQANTLPYQIAEGKHANLIKEKKTEIEKLNKQLEFFNPEKTPISIKPRKLTPVRRRGHTVLQKGIPSATFPTRTAAEEHIIANMSDQQLKKLTKTEGRRTLAKRALAELQAREDKKAGVTKGFAVKRSEIEGEPEVSQEVKDKIAELEKFLLPALRKLGLNDVALKIEQSIAGGRAGGSYYKSLIKIAMDEENPLLTMRHEALHALKALGFFTPQQWATLERKARTEWVNKYLLQRNADGKPIKPNEASRYDAYERINIIEPSVWNRENPDKPQRTVMSQADFMDLIIEEAIADAFADFTVNKPPAGMIAALMQRLNKFFEALRNAMAGAGFQTVDDIFGKVEAGELKALSQGPAGAEKKSVREPSPENAWQATPEDIAKAEKYAEKNGIYPYASTGKLELPTETPKYSLKTADKYGMDPAFNIPLNRDGTITVYYHTTKENAKEINRTKVITTEGKRIYLTNESSGAKVLEDLGSFDQEVDGSVVMLKLPPSMLQLDNEFEDGRKDMFIPVAQGEFFDRKMRMSAIQVSKGTPILGQGQTFSYKEYEDRIRAALQEYLGMSKADKAKRIKEAKAILKKEHNIGTLLTENGKLEKTRENEVGLQDMEENAASMGLGLAAAQRITDKISSCINSAICANLCLGDTAGGNQQYGGVAAKDVNGIEKSAFRAGPRMSQYLKTEAMIIHPEEFALVLNNELEKFKAWAKEETQRVTNPETDKRETVAKEVYAPSIRLNVTSDFKPSIWLGLMEANPDVIFYDYTKNNGDVIAPNHHLTYSSTGFGQIIDGEKISHKSNNWFSMKGRLDRGYNVAMAFTSKSALPDQIIDEATGDVYTVFDGDNYDARYMDPTVKIERVDGNAIVTRKPDTKGVIVGLRNKAGTMKEKESTVDTDGFFADYEPKRDGKIVRIPDQKEFGFPSTAKPERKTIPITPVTGEKLSVRPPPLIGRIAPNTPEFKRFFDGSKAINDDGSPRLMFHGTVETPGEKGNLFSVFNLSDDGKLGSGVYTTSVPVYAETFGFSQPALMPLYLSAKNPYNIDLGDFPTRMKGGNLVLTDEAFNALETQMKEAATKLSGKRLMDLEGSEVRKMFEKAGYDSIIAKDSYGNIIEALAFKPEQVKSATGNVGTYDPTNPDIRLSVRNIIGDQKVIDFYMTKTFAREEKGHAARMLEAITPPTFTSLRQMFLNQYDSLARLDNRYAKAKGIVRLMADSSAEAAALMSDMAAGVAARVIGMGGSPGGSPVYRNGATYIDNKNGTIKGPAEIFAPLAKYNDPDIYRAYQVWAGVKRGSRYMQNPNGTYEEKLFNGKDDIAYADFLLSKFPEFKQVQADWNLYNDGLVDYMVSTGVISKEGGEKFKKHGDYIPFYRQLEGEETIGPKVFQNISGVKPPKKAKGSEAPLADFLETVVRNTQAAIQSGMKNAAAVRTVDMLGELGETTKIPKPSGINTVSLLRDGKIEHYHVNDPLLVDSLKSLNLAKLPGLGFLSGPANLLRSLVTKDPGFMLANLMRDSMSAWVTSGQNFKPGIDTIRYFGKSLAGNSPEVEALLNFGMGGYEFSKNVEQSGRDLAATLKKKSGVKKTLGEKALTPFTSIWEGLEKGTTASDMATRAAIYKKVMDETGNETEALMRALEVMNFNRRGNSVVVRIATAAIPFFNARMQGLDVLYRAGIRPYKRQLVNLASDVFKLGLEKQESSEYEKQVAKTFAIRGLTMMAVSSLYWAMTHDDDEYLAQEQETRDNNWLLPSLGMRVPIPFEVGVLFKVIPERLLELSLGNDTGKDFSEAMVRNIKSSLFMDLMPQTIKPIYEVTTNYNFYTRRPIVGQGAEGLASEYEVGPGTSSFAEGLGKTLGVSPLKLDHLIKAYTGTIGMYGVDTIDAIIDANSDVPKATKRFEQMPFIKRFALDAEARGKVTAYYDLKNSVDEVVRTVNHLEKAGNYEEMGEYMKDNMRVLASKDYISALEKEMKSFREMGNMIRSSKMSGDEKRDALLAVTQAQNKLTGNIQEIKKMIASGD